MVDIPQTIDPVQPYRPQERPLAGKVAVVTGASANMGAALAQTLAYDGAHIVVHYRSDDKAAKAAHVVEQIQEWGGEALSFQADLSVPDNCTKLADATFEAFGRWDILINTAGTIVRKPLADITEDEYDGVLHDARGGAPDGRQRGDPELRHHHGWGASAHLQCLRRIQGPRGAFHQGAGQRGWWQGDHRQLHRTRPLADELLYPAESDENIGWLESMSINGQIGRGDDIMPVARLLVLPESGWATAQTIFVNGGIISTIN